MGWGERGGRDRPAGERMPIDGVIIGGFVNIADDYEGMVIAPRGERDERVAAVQAHVAAMKPVAEAVAAAAAAEATVLDLTARLELSEVDAGPALAWVPAGRAVRRFTTAVDELSAHDRDELRFLSASIAEQLTQLDLDPHDGRTGAGALGVLLAAHDHADLLAHHGRLDPAIASGVARVLVTVAIAVAGFAPEEVRNP